jgi:uncharacterized protein HemY
MHLSSQNGMESSVIVIVIASVIVIIVLASLLSFNRRLRTSAALGKIRQRDRAWRLHKYTYQRIKLLPPKLLVCER